MKENNEIMVSEELNDDIESMDYNNIECEGSGFGKLAVGLGILSLGAAIIAGVAYKCKDKLEERKIERLRKKGYVIFREDECEVHQMEDANDDVFVEEGNESETE